ncbi:MAG: fibronectin type III domain-containing protein, partial [Candidatus Cloacimonetes bacterium]|nr:fibronectin type III domain-containing protein [Candidatus Cloacimonadota bacterium]
QIPEGGYGYAWFVVEGELNGNWLPIMNTELIAEDAQGNQITCQTRVLPFQFLSSLVHIQNAGVFAIPIPSSMVGSGNPGSTESFSVMYADGQLIAPENRQSVSCEVIPYQYTANWGYRIYAKAGAGVTGVVATATGFAGGGSGANISLDLQGLSSDPEWSAFRINRRDDLFVGAEVKLGPPTLIDIGAPSASAQASFPYEREYEFDLDQMDGLEALLAYYLFAEPSLIYATGPIPGGQTVVSFLSWIVQVLIANNANNGLGIARIADEAGLDIEGNISFSTDLLSGLPLGMSMGASLGASAHLGASKKAYTSGLIQRRLSLAGEFKGAGPKLVPTQGAEATFFYPQKLRGVNLNLNLGVAYEVLGEWQNNSWQSLELSSTMQSSLSPLNIYNLPGATQAYTVSLGIDNNSVRNLLFNVGQTPQKMWNIGSSAVSLAANNTTFSQDFSSFLSTVYTEQNSDLPVKVGYATSCEDKTSYEMDLDLEFPLPVLPALVINLGGGLEATNSRSYDLAEGYWVKGYPYLQTEMANPPQPGVTFPELITGIWDRLTEGNIWQELSTVISTHLAHKFFGWTGLTRNSQVEVLNDLGSSLTLTANSIPSEVDSVGYSFWEWADEPEDPRLTNEQKEAITSYNRSLRKTREEALGLRYGIGGFHSFESSATDWNDAPLLKIVYRPEDVIGIDVQNLGMYWEDASGQWNYLPSVVVADSSFVSASIPYFSCYTLAPRLPQGSFGLSADPDSLLADGISTAQINSDTLYNNDGSVVAEATLYTVNTNRGTITSTDADPTLDGIQIAVQGGIISFSIQSDNVALPIVISANSVQGFSSSALSLPLYQVTPPPAPVLLAVQPELRALRLTWEEADNPGVIGYKINYGLQSGAPYSGTANVDGSDSPVYVGKTNQYTLNGLNNEDVCYVSISAVDASGLESEYSNEIFSQPVLQAVQNLEIQKQSQSVKLLWQPSHGATLYKIYRAETPNQALAEMTLIGQTSALTYNDNTITDLNSCFYVVVAVGY